MLSLAEFSAGADIEVESERTASSVELVDEEPTTVWAKSPETWMLPYLGVVLPPQHLLPE